MTDEKQIAKKLRDKFAQSYDDWDSGYRDIDFIIKKAKEEERERIYKHIDDAYKFLHLHSVEELINIHIVKRELNNLKTKKEE